MCLASLSEDYSVLRRSNPMRPSSDTVVLRPSSHATGTDHASAKEPLPMRAGHPRRSVRVICRPLTDLTDRTLPTARPVAASLVDVGRVDSCGIYGYYARHKLKARASQKLCSTNSRQGSTEHGPFLHASPSVVFVPSSCARSSELPWATRRTTGPLSSPRNDGTSCRGRRGSPSGPSTPQSGR